MGLLFRFHGFEDGGPGGQLVNLQSQSIAFPFVLMRSKKQLKGDHLLSNGIALRGSFANSENQGIKGRK